MYFIDYECIPLHLMHILLIQMRYYTIRRFVGKLLLERRFDQHLKIALFANNATYVPAGMYGD